MVAVVDLDAGAALDRVNGYAIVRSFDANSSFERPATISLPSTKAMSVIDSIRGLRCCPGAAWPGAFGSVALVIFKPSSETTASLPAPSTRTSTGFASAPVPRIAEIYAFFVFG